MKERPKIVCLCGSTRFHQEFQRANYEETMLGKIVLSVGFYLHASKEAHGETWGCTPEQKVALDELHKRKIDLAEEVLVLNVGQYIGDSTRSEVAYAIEQGKPVRWLEKPDQTPLPEAHGVRTKSPVGMWRCGRCGHYGVAMSGHPRDPEIGQVDVCQQCGHRQRFLGRSNIYDDAVWEWRGLPDEAKPEQEPDWSTHCLSKAGNARCRSCGEWPTSQGALFAGYTDICPTCGKVVRFTGYLRGRGGGWLWNDAGQSTATHEPIKTTQGTELVERWAAPEQRYGCPVCKCSWPCAPVQLPKHYRFECPNCKRMSEYLGLGGEAGDARWIWRTVPTKPQVDEPTEKRPALYYTVKHLNFDDSGEAGRFRARRGDYGVTAQPELWEHFASVSDAEQWIKGRISHLLRATRSEFIIVKHVAKRKQGNEVAK